MTGIIISSLNYNNKNTVEITPSQFSTSRTHQDTLRYLTITIVVISSSDKSYHDHQEYYNSDFHTYKKIEQQHWQLIWDMNELGSLSNSNC